MCCKALTLRLRPGGAEPQPARVYVVLAGGTGGSRFVTGLAAAVGEGNVTVIVNVADDSEFYGLYICPDIDSNIYALAGLVDMERGWGLRHDSFNFMDAGRRFGEQDWFNIGDHDLATHRARTDWLASGLTLSEAVQREASAFDTTATIIPASDDPLRSWVVTDSGRMAFQDYLVRRRAQDRVIRLELEGLDAASPAPRVLPAIAEADAIFIAPSNPVASIGPILALPGVVDALREAPASVVAVSPIVDGRPLQPPTGEMMSGLGREVSALEVARQYSEFADAFVLDLLDGEQAAHIAALGLEVHVTDTLMVDVQSRMRVARTALNAAGVQSGTGSRSSPP